jgi:hypothetical protein
MKRIALTLCSLAFMGIAVATPLAATIPCSSRATVPAVSSSANSEGEILHVAHWQQVHRWDPRHHKWWRRGDYNAPELDPGLLGSGIAVFAVTLLLLLERRRSA